MLISLVLAVSLGFAPQDAPKPPDAIPSPADLFALHRANRDLFGTLTVQWRRDHTYTEAWIARDARELVEMSKEVDAFQDSTSSQAQALRQQLSARSQLQANSRTRRRMDQLFQTDRTRFLQRTAPTGWEVGLPGELPAIPDLPIDALNLGTVFLNYHLTSHPEPMHGGFLQVTSNGQGSFVQAMLRKQNYPDSMNDMPPLATRDDSWGQLTRHPIDELFQRNPSEFATVGKGVIDGHEVIVIEHNRKGVNYFQAQGKPNIARDETIRMHIDANRGGLPLRVEWDSALATDGQPAPPKPGQMPDKVMEITEIVEVEGGGFYPSKGVIRVYAPPDPTSESDVLMEETTWITPIVKANAALPPTLATIPIPDNTYYYDEYRGRSVRMGFDSLSKAILPWTLTGFLVLGWVVYGIIAFIRKMSRGARGPATA